ncbi:MAG TPA: hypothetical protein VN285_06260 [Candidatus Deferrimicrobium sp.]|nr:hypothetical protein [Candidatus Deferrimicrobium sp.]
MSSGEVDYDQAFTATIGPLNAEWSSPPANRAGDYADGFGVYHQLSIGPFDIGPGGTLPIVFAYVAGENFHTNPHNALNLPYDPWAYYSNLDFSDLAKNAKWAEWIYDNPGVDTDGDGDSGQYRVCPFESMLVDSTWVYTRAETTWYKGDGIPDWKAAGPPPAPVFWLEPVVNGLRIRFNGQYSETTPDIFTHIVDFEGYRVYLGRDERVTSYSILASYDRHNFDKWVWNRYSLPEPQWELMDIPFTLDSLRCLYGSGMDPCLDSAFDPLLYTPSQPYFHPAYPESAFYFVKHDFNTWELGVSTPIRKVYPDEPDPRLLPIDSLTPERYTAEGYFKYFEYDVVVENLLATVPYWVNVTAFDFGSPKSGLWALEMSKTVGAKYTYPTHPSADTVYHGKVFVYPNPYRIDGRYRELGYEGRVREDWADDKVRAIHFANLPPRCTIEVYSLDGDLIRRIEHDVDPSNPNASHDQWNLITRNYQAVVSGLYYWTVHSPDGQTQIGKLVIIM